MSAQPYPGLRPFLPDEVDIFFGRERHVDQLLEKLGRGRFLGVVGPSGCGKSSLVRAGMIPALETGFLASAGARWRFAEMRPGDRPLARLAEALLAPSALGPERGNHPLTQGLLHAGLRRGPLALAEVLADTPLPPGTNLLILVDQFEEIFRYRRFGDSDEADAFVALLLATIAAPDLPVYVVLAMRSDFLGDCALFAGLPEALNESQFLTPRLDRAQRRLSIVGPAGVFGGQVEPALVNHLLNDMGDEPDQLPLMQHLLMRLWHEAQGSQTTTAQGLHVALTLGGYEAVGGFAEALSRHAEEAFAELDGEQQRIAELMFRALSERGDGERDTRRPVRLGEVAAIAGVEVAAVVAVAAVFQRPDRSFLTPPAGTPLDTDSLLDVSHESLIRQWHRLRDWVDREVVSATTYRRLAETARLWTEDRAGLWGPPDLDLALAWQQREAPTAAWATRYGGDFAAAMHFLAASEEKRDQDRSAAEGARVERERQRQVRQRSVLLAIGLAFSLGFALLAVGQWRQARAQSRLAEAAFLVSEANAQLERVPEHSLLLAIEALAIVPGEDTPNAPAVREVLHLALNQTQGRVLVGHEGSVSGVAISPDSRWLVSASADRSVRIWDLTQLDVEPEVWPGYGTALGVLAISPDSRWLATGAGSGLIRVRSLIDPNAEPRALAGHRDAITDLAWSTDSRLLLSGSEDRTARWWVVDRPDAAPTVLAGAVDAVSVVAISPDGRWLLAASDDNTTRLWRRDRPQAPPRLLTGHHGPVRAVAFDRDSRWLATGSDDNTARLWRLDGAGVGAEIVLRGHRNSVRHVAFDAAGRFLITGSYDDTARRWDLATAAAGTPNGTVFTGHQGAISALAISTDGRWLVTASWDKSARIWNLGAGGDSSTSLRLTGHGGPIRALAIDPSGDWLATASDDQTIRLWPLSSADAETSSIVLAGFHGTVSAVAFSPDGRWLVTASDDNTARLWDLGADNLSIQPRIIRGHASSITQAIFSPDGRWLVTASDDNTARRWDLAAPDTPPTILRGHTSSVKALAFSPDGRWLATGSHDATARLWGFAQADSAVTSVILSGHQDSLTTVAFSADGQRLVTAGQDGTARVWNVPTSASGTTAVTTPLVLTGHDAAVTAVLFRPGGQQLVTASRDATVRLWDLTAADPSAGSRVLRGHQAAVTTLALDGRGARLLSGSADHTARLWNLAAPDPAAGSKLMFAHAAAVTALLIGPLGQWALTASADATVVAWDLAGENPDAIGELRGHSGPIAALAASADGLLLATGSLDETARLWRTQVWELTLDQLAARACAAAGRNLSEGQWREYLPNRPYRKTCPDLPVPAR